MSRPGTAKPRDPDSYEFVNEEIAKDYRKLWEQYQKLQELQVTAANSNENGSTKPEAAGSSASNSNNSANDKMKASFKRKSKKIKK